MNTPTRIVFGATALKVSPICYGTWQLSPRFWLDQPKQEILAAMHAAVDAGLNFFDTADAYGDGYGETVLGEFLAGQPRDKLVICTKVFNHFNPDGSRYPDLSSRHIVERCEIQLRRLGLETIDLYLLHLFDQLTPFTEVTATLERLRHQGKIRQYGVSNFTVHQLQAIRREGFYNACQPAYSLVRTGIEADLLPYCQAKGIGVMVYSPLHRGLLSGKYDGTETFTDARQHQPDFQGARFQTIAAAVRSLKPLADKYGLSIYQLVLTATLMHPAIQVAIVGIKTAAQVREAAAVMGRTLSREDYFAVRQALAVDQGKLKDMTGKAK